MRLGKLYSIAKKYNTTASSFGRALRHTIEVVIGRVQIDAINKLFEYTVYTEKGKLLIMNLS